MPTRWATLLRLVVSREVLERIEPFCSVLRVDPSLQRLRALILDHQVDVLSFKMRLEVAHHLLRRAVELGPYLDSEGCLVAEFCLI